MFVLRLVYLLSLSLAFTFLPIRSEAHGPEKKTTPRNEAQRNSSYVNKILTPDFFKKHKIPDVLKEIRIERDTKEARDFYEKQEKDRLCRHRLSYPVFKIPKGEDAVTAFHKQFPRTKGNWFLKIHGEEAVEQIAHFTQKLSGVTFCFSDNDTFYLKEYLKNPKGKEARQWAMLDLVAMRLGSSLEFARTSDLEKITSLVISQVKNSDPRRLDELQSHIRSLYLALDRRKGVTAKGKKRDEHLKTISDFVSHYNPRSAGAVATILAQIANKMDAEKNGATFPKLLAHIEKGLDKTYSMAKGSALSKQEITESLLEFLADGLSYENAGPSQQLPNRLKQSHQMAKVLSREKDIESLPRLLNSFGKHFPPTQKNVDLFLKQYEVSKLTQVTRIVPHSGDQSLLKELIKNYSPHYRPNAPVAVIVLAKNVYSPVGFDLASQGITTKLLKKLKKHYKVLIYEKENKSGIEEALKLATKNAKSKTADLLFVMGHGQQKYLTLGDDNGPQTSPPPREALLTAEDGNIISRWTPYLSKNSSAVLFSCHTGQGCDASVNLANVMARGLSGRPVYASEDPISGIRLILDKSGRFTDVRFLLHNVEASTYRVTYRP